jgi:pimeloyl-ACP methyl ester carboxylesterase
MMQQAYAAVAPHPEHWTRLLTKLTRLLGTDYDWSSEIPAIKAPVLYIIGDADSIMLDTAVEFFGLLGGGKLDGQVGGLPSSSFAILPAVLHWDLLTHANLLLPLIPRFLDAPSVIHTE